MKAARLRIAIQKTGRLNNDCMDLLLRCGLKIKTSQNSLLCSVENVPVDILFVRDDDIPTLVMDGVCELGIVGENVLLESGKKIQVLKNLGFCRCRLAIALPEEKSYVSMECLQNLRIATSYPHLLGEYLLRHNVKAEIMTISGSVEIAPRLDMADAICDLVSTGRTLEENNLKEVAEVMTSQAVLIQTGLGINSEKSTTIALLLRRIEGVLRAQESKYIMFHLPKSALHAVSQMLPGCEIPTVIPLDGIADRVAVHAVSREGIFWGTLEKLKMAGASSILVLPIEKMMS